MAKLYPFQALRPKDHVQEIASVPYDVVSREEAKALAEKKTRSFLHVSRPEIDLPEGTDPHSEVAYKRAKENLEWLTSNGPLVTEETPCLYLYRLAQNNHEQIGVAGCFSLKEYEKGQIKKHELTRTDKEDDRTKHILSTRCQSGPVFLVHRDTKSLEDLVTAEVRQGEPLYDFRSEDGIQHTIWRIQDTDAYVKEFEKIPALYIADGHHRAKAAWRSWQELTSQNINSIDSAANRFLAVAFPASQPQVLAYHRVLLSIDPFDEKEFLEKIGEQYAITPCNREEPEKGEFRLFLGNSWYQLKLKKENLHALDVDQLQKEILEPILSVKDIRTDERFRFVGGVHGLEGLEKQVHEGAKAAFAVHPTLIEQVLDVSDRDEIMPPKSTWFEPKLRDGILSYKI